MKATEYNYDTDAKFKPGITSGWGSLLADLFAEKDHVITHKSQGGTMFPCPPQKRLPAKKTNVGQIILIVPGRKGLTINYHLGHNSQPATFR